MDNKHYRKRRRRPQSKRRRQRAIMIKFICIITIVVGMVAALFLWNRYSPSKDKADLNRYYGIEQEDHLAVVVDEKVLDPGAITLEGRAYVEYGLVRDYINNRFYWDTEENILLYALPDEMVTVGVGKKEYSIARDKKSEDYVIVKTEGNTAYIALDFVKKYTDMEYRTYEEPGRVVVDLKTKTKASKVKKGTQVRYQAGVKSPVLTDVKKGDYVTIIEDEGDWKKVRTEDGFVGYVKKNVLKNPEEMKRELTYKEPEYEGIAHDYVVNMAWHNVTNADANNNVLERIAQTKGLTTISPTWFHVKNTSGDIDSIASGDYVNYVHQANMEVWAAVRDFDGGISSFEETYELLRKTSSRENLINQLISASLQAGIDGINVDFEKVNVECGEHYIQFIRELSIKCHQNGLVLSVDNYVPQAFNEQYHREEQGKFADYVIIMGYDEHYSGSPEAGSVSSYNFVKNGIEKTLEQVPAEKVISAVPFFTRIWKETPKTKEELAEQKGTEEAEYPNKVESIAYSMEEAANAVSQAGAKPKWDKETKQNYAEWKVENSTYKVWLEDKDSLELKLQLIQEYNLAGSAAWRLGQETPDIWELILKYVN